LGSPVPPVSTVKLADIEPLIWLIIFVVVAVAKGWSKLQQSTDDTSSEADEPPPLVPPKPQAPPPRPRMQPRPVGPPTARPAVRPQRPVLPRATPSRAPAPMRGERKVDVEQIRRLVENLGGKPQLPPPVPAPTQPVARAGSPAPPPQPETAPSATPAQPLRSRGSLWMEALRDQQNIRNIIIASEIIGPPKAESA
jgi:hypothetical protein